MFQIIQNQICTDILWDEFAGIVDNWRQRHIDGYDVNVKKAATVSPDARYFFFTDSILLKNQNALGFDGRFLRPFL